MIAVLSTEVCSNPLPQTCPHLDRRAAWSSASVESSVSVTKWRRRAAGHQSEWITSPSALDPCWCCRAMQSHRVSDGSGLVGAHRNALAQISWCRWCVCCGCYWCWSAPRSW